MLALGLLGTVVRYATLRAFETDAASWAGRLACEGAVADGLHPRYTYLIAARPKDGLADARGLARYLLLVSTN